MTRQDALTAIAALDDTDLKTLANAALLAVISLEGRGVADQRPSERALVVAMKTLVSSGASIDG